MSRFAYLIIGLLGMVGCRENQPQYQLTGPVDAARTIVVEEFSGARCPNCPQGTDELENLKSIYGENLIIVTIHAGDFAFKYDDSKFDFTTPGGDVILQMLGNPIGYPSAVINRSRADDQSDYQTFLSRWGSLISDELEKPQTLAIHLDISFNAANRQASVDINIAPLEDITRRTKLTVLIKEDGIIDPQADRAESTGVVKDYVHKNVLRTFLSDPQGDPLADRLTAFENLSRSYVFVVPEEDGWWQIDGLSLVAFVALDEAEDIAILQGSESKLVP